MTLQIFADVDKYDSSVEMLTPAAIDIHTTPWDAAVLRK